MLVGESSVQSFCLNELLACCVDVFDECIVVDADEMVLSGWTELSTFGYYLLRSRSIAADNVCTQALTLDLANSSSQSFET
jgi:hypothetical protein